MLKILTKDFSLEELKESFERCGYICDQEVTVTAYLALKLGKPLLVTGPPGVGKTEIAKVLSQIFATELIRLQCYEGLDEGKALYEWDYKKQLLMIQAACGGDIFSKEYLLARPLLKALIAEKQVVLLIDEIDKADEEFEAFLFEILSDFQVSIPELGTISAKQIPIVILTSNNERELSDGLKRRCAFLYIDYPAIEKEVQIVRAKVPEVGEHLAAQIAEAVHCLRTMLDLKKKPAVSETIDWTRSLVLLDADRLSPEVIAMTMNIVLKDEEDMKAFQNKLGPDGLYEAVQKGE